MSIPLVQNNEKDSINTSLIAIKRSIERINALLGLADSSGSSPDLNGLATKQELEDAITQVETDLAPVDEVTLDNMQSVTSNAVAKANSYSTTEHKTGRYWLDGKPTYEITLTGTLTSTNMNINHGIANIDNLVKVTPIMRANSGVSINPTFYVSPDYYFTGFATKTQIQLRTTSVYVNSQKYEVTVEYTKTTDVI